MDKLMNDEKHYVTLNNYLRYKYHTKVARISLNAGLSCPNRDGKISYGGCIYCSSNLSGDFAGKKTKPFKDQFDDILNIMKLKWDTNTFIAYLQAGTNTYADIDKLRKIYTEILSINHNIKVLSIATRPDCINESIVELLKEINESVEVWIELGLQTIHEETASLINRGYQLNTFDYAMNLLKNAKIKVIVHIINGLPFESKEMMIETVKYLNNYNLFGIKIHMLHIMKNTYLGNNLQKFKELGFNSLTLDEFIDITTTQLRYLNTNTIIHRLTGDAPKDLLIEPTWTLKKFVVLNEIDKHMRKNKIYQGDLCIK